MSDTPTPPADETPEQLRERIKELERRIAGLTFENDGLKAIAYPILMKDFPDKPLTEEEVHDMFHGPRGKGVLAIIDELQRELDDRGGRP